MIKMSTTKSLTDIDNNPELCEYLNNSGFIKVPILKIKEPPSTMAIPIYIEQHEKNSYSRHKLFNIFMAISNEKKMSDCFFLINDNIIHDEMLLFYFNFHSKYDVNNINPSNTHKLNNHFIDYMKAKYKVI